MSPTDGGSRTLTNRRRRGRRGLGAAVAAILGLVLGSGGAAGDEERELPEPGPLRFVVPLDGAVLAGSNLLLWATDEALPGDPQRSVRFELTWEGLDVPLVLPTVGPDYGPGNYTATLDTADLPPGEVRLRAVDDGNGDAVEVGVRIAEATISKDQMRRAPPPEDGEHKAPCGCERMIVHTQNQSQVRDPRRPGGGTFQPAPLGPDPTFLSYDFEVEARFTDGSDPAGCPEGQEIRRTFTSGGTVDHKRACAAGRDLPSCRTDRDCDTLRCTGGSLDGGDCNEPAAAFRCQLGGGRCAGQGDGRCGSFPFAQDARGNDDYRRPTVPSDAPSAAVGPKLHLTGPPRAIWLDPFGAPTLPLAETPAAGPQARWDADFLAFVRGPDADSSCSCHFTVTLIFDPATHTYADGTGLTLVDDAETVRCAMAQ